MATSRSTTAGACMVADGFHFTNEIRLDAREKWLYVAETCARRITRLRVLDDGSHVDREVFGPVDHGAFIDGIAFDAHGNLWGTHVMTDRIFAITRTATCASCSTTTITATPAGH